jgi:hypothetical protein
MVTHGKFYGETKEFENVRYAGRYQHQVSKTADIPHKYTYRCYC